MHLFLELISTRCDHYLFGLANKVRNRLRIRYNPVEMGRKGLAEDHHRFPLIDQDNLFRRNGHFLVRLCLFLCVSTQKYISIHALQLQYLMIFLISNVGYSVGILFSIVSEIIVNRYWQVFIVLFIIRLLHTLLTTFQGFKRCINILNSTASYL